MWTHIITMITSDDSACCVSVQFSQMILEGNSVHKVWGEGQTEGRKFLMMLPYDEVNPNDRNISIFASQMNVRGAINLKYLMNMKAWQGIS